MPPRNRWTWSICLPIVLSSLTAACSSTTTTSSSDGADASVIDSGGGGGGGGAGCTMPTVTPTMACLGDYGSCVEGIPCRAGGKDLMVCPKDAVLARCIQFCGNPYEKVFYYYATSSDGGAGYDLPKAQQDCRIAHGVLLTP